MAGATNICKAGVGANHIPASIPESVAMTVAVKKNKYFGGCLDKISINLESMYKIELKSILYIHDSQPKIILNPNHYYEKTLRKTEFDIGTCANDRFGDNCPGQSRLRDGY